jgi:hypothetical protein
MSGIRALASILLALLPLEHAGAADVLGHYPGGVIGLLRAETQASTLTLRLGAAKRLVGGIGDSPRGLTRLSAALRAMTRLSAEPDRVDPGHPADGPGTFAPDTSPYGGAAYGELELPLQARGIDVYAIAGFVPARSVLNALVSQPEVSACPGCDLQPFPPHHTDAGFAGGAGGQIKLGSWALRLECQCFIAGAGHPGFILVGFTRKFP